MDSKLHFTALLCVKSISIVKFQCSASIFDTPNFKIRSICSTAWGRRQPSTTLPLCERQHAGSGGCDLPGRVQGGAALPGRQARAQGGPWHPGQLVRSKNRGCIFGEQLPLPPLLWTSLPRRSCGREKPTPGVDSRETGAVASTSIKHFPFALLPLKVGDFIIRKVFDQR